MEEKSILLNQAKQERDEFKRLLEIMNTKYDNLKFESQREIESSKLKYREELQGIMKENQKLLSQIELSKDRDLLRQARRDLEEAKRRMEEYQKECTELRKERDSIKDEKNDIIITHNRDIEYERSRKREAIAENDKLKFKVRSLEDDIQKIKLDLDRKIQEVLKYKGEKQSITSILNEKDLTIETIRRQLNEVKDKIKDKEDELQSYLRRKSDEETNFELVERRRYEKLQSDLDTITKEYRILEVERANDKEKQHEQFNRLEYNYKSRCDENRKLTKQFEELQKDYKALKADYVSKCDEYDITEREYRKYQDQNRQLLIDSDELKNKTEEAKVELKLLEEKMQKNAKAQAMNNDAWTREKKDLELRIVQLLKTLESYKNEGTKDQLNECKRKTNEYKQKVRLANETIAKLTNKLMMLNEEYNEDHENNRNY